MIAIMTIAMTFVIAAGELDLSIGSSAAFSALVATLVMAAGHGIGAHLIGTINNGLIIMGLDVSEQMVISGGLIMAVAFGRRPSKT